MRWLPLLFLMGPVACWKFLYQKMYRATACARISVGQDMDSRGAVTERRAAAGTWCGEAAGMPPRPWAVLKGAVCRRGRRRRWSCAAAKFLLMK
jgi:hypothetical protein